MLCTHLHVDHVGWNTKLEDGRWVPTFPNATYLFGDVEYRYWEAASREIDFMRQTFDDSVLPVVEAGRAEFIDKDFEIDTGLSIEETPGHTPGHVCLNLARGAETAVFCGDLMHHALQVPEPQLSTIFCSDADESRRTRTGVRRALHRYRYRDPAGAFPRRLRGADQGGKRLRPLRVLRRVKGGRR